MIATYQPDVTVDNFDTNHVNNAEWKDQEAVAETELQLRRDSIQELFKGYYFNKHDIVIPKPEHRESMLLRNESTQYTTKGANLKGSDEDD